MKILFSDYDNTLFRNEEEIIKNLKYINEFINSGNMFVIASGRSYSDLLPELEKYNIPFHYLVLDNGANIYDKDINLLYSFYIEDNISKSIYDLVKDNEYLIIKNIYSVDVKDSNYLSNCTKMNFVFNNINEGYRLKEYIDNKYSNYVNAYLSLKSDRISLEIISNKTNKGNGVKLISELNNIDKDNIYVIGDNNNDIQMIKMFNGYSVNTAIEELKMVSIKSYDGVYELIKEIL